MDLIAQARAGFAGVDADAAELDRSRGLFPDLPVVQARLDRLTADDLGDHGADFDLVVCVGNVLVFLAEGTERAALTRLHALTRPGGRMVVGFCTIVGGALLQPASAIVIKRSIFFIASPPAVGRSVPFDIRAETTAAASGPRW